MIRVSIGLTLFASLAFAQAQFPYLESAQKAAAREAEEADLQRAVTEAQTSPQDLIRTFEAFLVKHPKPEKRNEIIAAMAKASADIKDFPRTAKYGEQYLDLNPDDVLMLDRTAAAMLNVGGEENVRKALKYSRFFEDLIEQMGVAEGKDAAGRQEERERARGRTILYQARARALLGDKDEAVRQAARSFDVYPSEESAREWGETLVTAGREKEAISRFAEALTIPDAHATDQQRLDDRLRMGQIYTKLMGSEKGLGDIVLEAYDHTSTIVETRRKKVLSLDPNSTLADPMQFTVTGLDGKKLQLSSLKGKVIVMDYWATWCAPCKVQHPLYEDVKKFFAGRSDVVFLPLNTDEERQLVAPFLEAQSWDKQVYFDDGLARLMQVTSIPTTVIIDKNGMVASRMNGFLADSFVSTLTARVQELLR